MNVCTQKLGQEETREKGERKVQKIKVFFLLFSCFLLPQFPCTSFAIYFLLLDTNSSGKIETALSVRKTLINKILSEGFCVGVSVLTEWGDIPM